MSRAVAKLLVSFALLLLSALPILAERVLW